MALNSAAKNLMLDAIGAEIHYISVHTAATAGSEITGGDPAYARKAVSWADAASGDKLMSGVLEFNIPAGVEISHLGYWTTLTGGTNYGFVPLTDSNGTVITEVYNSQGTYQVVQLKLELEDIA